MQQKIILASSSPFRRQLMDRLRLAYEAIAPDIDERHNAGENAVDYVCRLAAAKAGALAATHPQAVIVGSDQCALLDGRILGKPGNHQNALEQLRQCRGKTVVFHTAVCVLRPALGFDAVAQVPFEVDFRHLEDARLERYLKAEQPYDCAGSFKAEGYGICLFERLRGDDPTALIGLPLIRLVALLEQAGVEVL